MNKMTLLDCHTGRPRAGLRAAGAGLLSVLLLLQGLAFAPAAYAQRVRALGDAGQSSAPGVYTPEQRPTSNSPPVTVRSLAAQRALAPASDEPVELKPIHPPGDPGFKRQPQFDPDAGLPQAMSDPQPQSPAPVVASPPPSLAFKSDQFSLGGIPPDTMGAVGPNHVVTATNDELVFHDRAGKVLSTVLLDDFWAGTVGIPAAPNTYDPKIYYDRFTDRWIISTQAEPQTMNSASLLGISQTSDPTGSYHRYAVKTDAAATATTGRWADYPSVGFNKNWVAINVNLFGFGTGGSGFRGQAIYVFDKVAAAAGTLTTASTFEALLANCATETDLACGFTMVPATTEDNTTETLYIAEDWLDGFQLRLSRITGTGPAPVLTVGYQFPRSPFSWRFNAVQIGGSAGYVPQRAPNGYGASGVRLAGNDSRIQNTVYRDGSLWTVHHVMVAAAPTVAPAPIGGATNPIFDQRAAVQWWEIDPTLVSNEATGTPPIQRGRIEDPLADNCHNGNAGTRAGCALIGDHYTFPTIAVNENDDVLIGYSRGSALTLGKAGYSFRAAADPPNTMRDSMVFREGQATYSLFDGTRVRWGDYSQTVVDPVNLTDFWTIQEYSEDPVAVFAPPNSNSAIWSTWWSLVRPTSTTSYTGNLIISEFRFRGPDPDGAGTATGARDEYVELYNPSATPLTVNVTDGSDGWALATTTDGTTVRPLTVIPNGTTIAPRGRLLIANNARTNPVTTQDLGFSLKAYPNTAIRNSGNDVAYGGTALTAAAGFLIEIPDNSGVAIFKTAIPANMTAATRMDSVGFETICTANPASIFKEGTCLPNLTIPAGGITGQIGFHRNQSTGAPQDTGDNSADFIFTNTVPTETLGSTPRLGAPGPQNLDSPIINTNVFVDRFDLSVAVGAPPNRVRRLCSDPLVEECDVNRSAQGTISMRRRVTNYTGANVSRLRWRLTLTTTAPAPPGVADLRAITSSDIIVNGQPVRGTTLEQPATQALGGGWNASWSVALPTPIAPGGSINVQFLFGVQQGGTFSVLVHSEALP